MEEFSVRFTGKSSDIHGSYWNSWRNSQEKPVRISEKNIFGESVGRKSTVISKESSIQRNVSRNKYVESPKYYM